MLLMYAAVAVLGISFCHAQDKALQFSLNEDGSRYIRVAFLNQVWLRYSEANPGSTQFGAPKSSLVDVSLRRTRIQLYGEVANRAFVYFQFGQNSFNMANTKQLGAFFHDALGEYYLLKDGALKLGGGLTGASGLSRVTQPSAGTILTADLPVFAQATTGITDQFSRRLSAYARGQIGKLDYRVIFSNPFAPSASYTGITKDIGVASDFAVKGAGPMYQGYFFYQFLDKEGHATPYMIGSYLGKKTVFNIGAGFIFQDKGMWRLKGMDTSYSSLMLLATDAFLDMPLNSAKGTALSSYLAYFNNNYGQNYIRNVGVNNPYTGTTTAASFNGAGIAFPMMGTGDVVYSQAGYLLPKKLFGDESRGTLQPYASLMYGNYKALRDPVTVYNIGLNYLIAGNRSKLSLNYESRPVYYIRPNGDITSDSRKGLYYLQYQVSL